MRKLALFVWVAVPLMVLACGDDGMDPPPMMPDGDIPGMDADMPDGDPPAMDGDVPDGDPPMMDADVPDGDPPMMDGDVPDAEPPAMVSWSREVLPMLRSNCSGCHTTGSRGNWSIGTSGDADRAYATLVDGSGTGVGARGVMCGGQTRVVPGNPAMSLLYSKVSARMPLCGGSMPPRGMLSPANQEMLRLWILQGAMNN